MDELLNCCPKCGSTLEFSNLMQYSDVYKITRSGKLSKKRIRKEDCGPMECGYISCTKCDFVTDAELYYRGKVEEIRIYQKEDMYYYKKILI